MASESGAGPSEAKDQIPILLGLPLPIFMAAMAGLVIVIGSAFAPGMFLSGGGIGFDRTMTMAEYATLYTDGSTSAVGLSDGDVIVIVDIVQQVYYDNETRFTLLQLSSAPDGPPLPLYGDQTSYYSRGDMVRIPCVVREYTYYGERVLLISNLYDYLMAMEYSDW